MRFSIVFLAVGLVIASTHAGPAIEYGSRWTAGGKEFVQVLTPLNWTDASELCAEMNATLVSWASQEDIDNSFYHPSMTNSSEFDTFYTGLKVKLPPKSANAELKRQKPPPNPPKPPKAPKAPKPPKAPKAPKAKPGSKPPPAGVKQLHRMLKGLGAGAGVEQVAQMRRLQQSWRGAGTDARLLENSGFTWPDGTSTSWIRTQTPYMTIRDCPQAANRDQQAECCGYAYNTGPAVYDGHTPLINFTPCKDENMFVCAKRVGGAA